MPVTGRHLARIFFSNTDASCICILSKRRKPLKFLIDKTLSTRRRLLPSRNPFSLQKWAEDTNRNPDLELEPEPDRRDGSYRELQTFVAR